MNNIELNISNENENDKEIYLKNLGNEALEYYFLYMTDYKYNTRLVTYTIIPIIIISTFTGTATIFQPYINPDNHSIYLIIIGCCNIIAGLLTLLKEYSRIVHMEQNISYVAYPYKQLGREIQLHLCLKKNQRDDDKEFAIKCKDRMDRIHESTPGVSEYAYKKLKELKKPSNNNKQDISEEISSEP